MRKGGIILAVFAGFLCAAGIVAPARAQETSGTGEKTEITAEQTLEWHRKDRQFIATGAVRVTQGDTVIAADTITADYTDGEKSGMKISRLTAQGHVSITSKGNTATGDRAVYDVEKGTAIMTGDSLKLTAPDQIVTAKDSFTYDVTQGRLTATGTARAVRGSDELAADTISAIFTQDATGTRQLNELTADGHVVITTPEETLHGAKGRYTAKTQLAELTGGVRIERGPNVLEGERAEINLATDVSRMIGGTAEGGRVRGVFYPGSEKRDAAPRKPAIDGLLTAP